VRAVVVSLRGGLSNPDILSRSLDISAIVDVEKLDNHRDNPAEGVFASNIYATLSSVTFWNLRIVFGDADYFKKPYIDVQIP
jgi:hypothetical protein